MQVFDTAYGVSMNETVDGVELLQDDGAGDFDVMQIPWDRLPLLIDALEAARRRRINEERDE